MVSSERIGVIIVDHGSRRDESNQMLQLATARFREQSQYPIVEPAHMELASPDIATAFARCVQQGATRIVVFPYFLSPGRHWSEDIPRLTAQAAAAYPEVPWLVTAPFGMHPAMSTIIGDRIQHCLQTADSGVENRADGCDVCGTSAPCRNTGPST